MEIELKYLVEEPIAREKILKDSHLSEIKEKGSEGEIKLDAVYYDTADMDLCRGRMAFRIRLENGNPVATLKWGGQVSDGLHVRGEFNTPADRSSMADPDPEIFKGSEIYDKFKEIVGGKKLKEIMRVECLRKQMMVDTGKSIDAISLDMGKVITANGQAQIAELEIELFSGDKDDMIALGRELAAKYNLIPGNKSKFQIGLELIEG